LPGTTFRAQRELSDFLLLQASRQSDGGDFAGAIETLRDCEAHARAVRQDATWIGHRLSASEHFKVLLALEEIAAQALIGPPPPAGNAGGGPADPRAVRALIGDLLDDGLVRSARKAVISEAAFSASDVNYLLDLGLCLDSSELLLANGSLPGQTRVRSWALDPMFRCDLAGFLQDKVHLIEAMRETSLAKAEAMCPVVPQGPPESRSTLPWPRTT
jgi:hypothetical protein